MEHRRENEQKRTVVQKGAFGLLHAVRAALKDGHRTATEGRPGHVCLYTVLYDSGVYSR